MRLRDRLTYANVMATTAMFIALGGTSWAVATITSTDVVDGSLRGVDLRANTITGDQVRESRLGKVPAARRADSAATADSVSGEVARADSVDGLSLGRIAYRSDATTSSSEIADIGGLQLIGNCLEGPDGPDPFLGVRTTRDNAVVQVSQTYGNGEVAQFKDTDFDTDRLEQFGRHDSILTIAYSADDGSEVTATVQVAVRPSGERRCSIGGTAVHSPNS